MLAAGLALLAVSRSPGPALGLVELLVSEAYPVGDVLVLALAARLATTRAGARPPASSSSPTWP